MSSDEEKHLINIDIMHTAQDIQAIKHLLGKIENRIQQGLLPSNDNIDDKHKMEGKKC